MSFWTQITSNALVSGTAGALLSALTLSSLSRREGGGAARPLNATSHLLHGDAAATDEVDAGHTLVGFAIHHASGIFWALLFEALRAREDRQPPSLPSTVRSAALTSGIAAAVDYGLVPRRLTPGWELAVSKRSMAAGFAALAAGLALGGLIVDAGRRRKPMRA